MSTRRFSASGYVEGAQVAARYADLISVSGYYKGAGSFLQLHETTGAPTAGRVPEHVVRVFETNNYFHVVPVGGIPFSQLWVCLSSTADTYTAEGASDITICAVLR